MLARVQWPNQNALRRYPLAVFASGVDLTGNLTLPTSTFVDLRLSVPYDVGLHFGGFYIHDLLFSNSMFVINLAHRSTGELVARAVGELSRVENAQHQLLGTGVLAGSRGHLVTGDTTELRNSPPGHYFFHYDAAALDPSAVYVQPKAIRSVTVVSSGGQSQEMTGRLRLVSGAGTQFRLETQDDGVQTIVWDAIGVSDLRKDCECDNSYERPVLTVGGLPPDSTGAVNIFGSRCLEIATQSAGLKLQNTCSEPCCDCQEDSGIEGRLDMLRQQYITMETRVAALESRFDRTPTLNGDDEGCDKLQCQPFDPTSNVVMLAYDRGKEGFTPPDDDTDDDDSDQDGGIIPSPW